MRKNSVIGVDMGGTNIRAAVIDSAGEISYRDRQDTGSDPVAALKLLLDKVIAQANCSISAIGIATAGVIDHKSGVVLRSPNMGPLAGVNLKSEVSTWHNLPVVVENDANAAAYGEKALGAGVGKQDFVLLTLGTGIGGGIVANGRLLGISAEVGHIKISTNGNPCSCGDIGCLEAYASGWAIVSSAIKSMEEGAESIMKQMNNGNFYKITPEDIYSAALEGDALARGVLREAGKHLGTGIASMINIFNPQAVILTGGLTGAWNIYVDAAVKEASKRTLKELFSEDIIIPSTLGGDAGIIGAAFLALEAS
ncbi:MAG: ROK family protein [Nitrospiraceae bacterium]|nr:ROK family protein [Nitrospiraceae bacterium]